MLSTPPINHFFHSSGARATGKLHQTRSKPRLLGSKGGLPQQGREAGRSVQRCVTLHHYGQKDSSSRINIGKDTNKVQPPDKSQTSLKKLSAKDKLNCFREIFKQSLKQCEALRTTMIKDSSPDRVRSVSVVDSYRGIGGRPVDDNDPAIADNLISRRVRAITSLNQEDFARSSIAGPLSISETEAIRRKVETLITDYIGQNERFNSTITGNSPRLDTSPRVNIVALPSPQRKLSEGQQPKPNPTIRFESRRLENKEKRQSDRSQKEKKTQQPARRNPAASPSPKPERFMGLREQSLRQLSLLLQSGGVTQPTQPPVEPVADQSTDSPTQIIERRSEEVPFYSHRSESRKSRGGNSGKTVQVMPCARKKLASVQQSRAHSKETTKGPEKFLSPQPSVIESEIEWQIGPKKSTESRLDVLLSPQSLPRNLTETTSAVNHQPEPQEPVRIDRRSNLSRRKAHMLAVSEVDVPADLLKASRNSFLQIRRSEKREQRDTNAADLSLENLKSALRKISQEKRNPFRPLKSSEGKSRRQTVNPSLSQQEDVSRTDKFSTQAGRIRGYRTQTFEGKIRNSSLQPRAGGSEPEWFEEQSSQAGIAEPVSIKILGESNRRLDNSDQQSNPVLRARNYLDERRIDTAGPLASELSPEQARKKEITNKLLGLVSSRHSEPNSTVTRKSGRSRPKETKQSQGNKDLIKSGNLISISNHMVLEDSQTQEQLPRDRKPPKAVMLYKSLPKGALNSAVELPSSPKVRQSTPSAIQRMLQHAKSREDLLTEGSRKKRPQVNNSSVVQKKSSTLVQTDKTKEIRLGVNPQLQVQLARAIVSLRDSSVTPKLLEETIPTHMLKPIPNNVGTSSSRGVTSHRTHDPSRTEFVAGSGGLKDVIIDNKSIGKGSYATVKTGYHIPSKMEVAVKIYDKLKMVDPRRRANLVHELQNLSEMDHLSIVKLYTKIEDATKIYLVMEFGGALHLKDFVKGRKEGWLTPSEVKVLFSRIVQGVHYMHAKNVVHRDLKLQNIVLKSLESPKLVDFGFSRKGLYSHFEESCGTPNYMAPELLTNKKRSQAVFADIWALGVILHYLLLKRYPFRGRSEDELFANIKSGKTDLRGLTSPAAVDLLTRLLHPDPQQRPLSAEILSHSWFKSH